MAVLEAKNAVTGQLLRDHSPRLDWDNNSVQELELQPEPARSAHSDQTAYTGNMGTICGQSFSSLFSLWPTKETVMQHINSYQMYNGEKLLFKTCQPNEPQWNDNNKFTPPAIKQCIKAKDKVSRLSSDHFNVNRLSRNYSKCFETRSSLSIKQENTSRYLWSRATAERLY